ncbi:MAG: polysaccharide biosynthesis protein CapD [Acidobacteria bacterium]|nr:polysaccharide biosynthesis protein CapD [Acidobacteriota bacterium]
MNTSHDLPINELQSEGRLRSALRRYSLSTGMQIGLDFAVLLAAFVLAYLLRFDFDLPRDEWHNFLVQAPLVILLQFLALSIAGARGSIWRYTGMAHIKSFLYSASASLAIVAIARLTLPGDYRAWRVPLSVAFIDCMLAFGGAFGLRVLRRGIYENAKRRRQVSDNRNADNSQQAKRPVLLIGAGQAGVLAAKEIDGRGDLDLDIKGFIDDDRSKLGRAVVLGHRVVGSTKDLARLVQSMDIDHVVITIAQASRQDIHRIVKLCEQIPIKVRIIPGLYEILDGRVGISRIRDVQIEDLLGREPVQLDVQSISRELAGKTVMVTGAGGSIGSELARQVLRFSPTSLLLVERAEFALFEIDQELSQANPAASIVAQVADIGDEVKMRALFDLYRPQVVIHAAAHKHVPLMESNPFEAIRNNVLCTRLLGELAGEFQTGVFVLVSTDKAVRPASIMGASKRVAELVVQDLNCRFETRYVAVRFGNVIGSAGSVIPIFQQQIRKGGPVTITDKRMQRYFMTIPEAAQLVLQASAIGQGGEVFILHMGELVRILDLAETLITLSGFKPHEDIKIVETGIRPGEKLYEELQFETEETVATSHPKIFINKLSRIEPVAVQQALTRLEGCVRDRDEQALRSFLDELLPEAQLNGKSKKPIAHSAGAAQ